MNLEKITASVVAISQEIGDWILTEQHHFDAGKIELKAFNNLVSYVDKESERKFIAALSSLIEDSGFIGEEGISNTERKKYTWIIDPLDGTTNFSHKIPVFCTSVALLFEDTIILGVVYDPSRKECFYAFENGGAYLNGTSISVSKTAHLKDSLVATGFPYDDFSRLQPYVSLFSYLAKSTRGIRRMGSAAIDLCYVACGRFDVFYEYALSPWDVAAGALIIKEAGGSVTDFNGTGNYLFGNDIIGSNTVLHKDFLKVVKSEFIAP